MEREACCNAEQQEVSRGGKEEESINQSHDTKKTSNHNNYMVITDTHE